MTTVNRDVIVIGAGLAGLCCARALRARGISCLLLEASDGVGGRVRTDEIEGFRLDRGFQVLLTAYPEVRRTMDLNALDLRPFFPGALMRSEGRFERLVDPWRRPLDAFKTLFTSKVSLADRLSVARLHRRAFRGPLEDIWQREETTTLDVLRNEGASEAFIDRFFRPYLGGIFLDPHLSTSSRMLDFVFRMMATGDVSLPALGMGAIPQQLAAGLPEGWIRTDSSVVGVDTGSVTLESGEVLSSRSIVVATDWVTARGLVPELSNRGSCGVTCIYFASEKPPLEEPVLVLNGEGGPINNLAVISNVAPSYAPSGASLVSVTVLGVSPPAEEDRLLIGVREQLASWYGPKVHDWRHLRTYSLPQALPAQPAPVLSIPERPVRMRPGLYICGDHRDNASLNGAMVSGKRAAEAILEDLSSPVR